MAETKTLTLSPLLKLQFEAGMLLMAAGATEADMKRLRNKGVCKTVIQTIRSSSQSQQPSSQFDPTSVAGRPA